VEFVHRFQEDADKEIAGFLASQFAYGRIDVMKRFLGELFERLGASPSRFVEGGDFGGLRGLYYRLHKDGEIIRLFEVLRRITGECGGIGGMLGRFYDGDVRAMLWAARAHLLEGREGLTFFFPMPSPTNPAKRWNLYLRWMVRSDEIDTGIWNFIKPADLTVPLDTHIAKIGGCLNWTRRRNPCWAMAREITEALRRYSPDDPLKYDFFLCHAVGISAGCTGERSERCEGRCSVYEMGC
jgi:uncharacterized protein (TIGR02757 family)